MIFEETELPGVLVVHPQPHADERGYFARGFCQREFAARGLCTEWAQMSASFNHRRGTLRGMHYQAPPHEEIKLVRCTRGAIYDVALDLRAASPTFRKWTAVELTAASGKMLYIPRGVAHGFQTLLDESEVLYCIWPAYAAEASRGVRWDDPAFAVDWPECPQRRMSPRDATLPDFSYTHASAS